MAATTIANMIRHFNNPAYRGALTGVIMILAGVLIKENNWQDAYWSQYVLFILYAAGITWTLWIAKHNHANTGRFGSLFQQGFRHFAVTSLVMVGFTFYILWRHPEFAKEEAEHQRTLLIETKKYTPDQINELVIEAEKQYPVRHISATVFGYLFMGAVFAAAGSVVLARKN